ncbi:disease resistance protein At4g27190-like [Durio zibethinus]|uniref:Disease resistance protein At4g27190-like n=1 Tax=Durio zibethinus TaxID=66656 RepID=A0A6P6A9T3_DURZI|nr:disease resistance protein At4g27190-like [Durio zibethinus]XP_022761537.1 disease resistance protein At4g27190-like [Durio zibethinus]
METLAVQAAGQAAGSLVTPAVEGGKGIFNCLKLKYGYVKKIKENMAKLEKEELYLRNEDEDVKITLDRNKLTKEKTNRCETWLNEVDKMRQEIERLKVEYKNTSTYLCGLCPFPGLLKLGKRIVKKTAAVVELRNQLAQITKMHEKPPAPPIPVIEKHARKKSDVPSFDSCVETLVEWLEDEQLKRICIWGPPGVGKTTIMEILHNTVGASGKFDIIFWVTLTKEGGIRDIQDEIWKRLDTRVDCNYGANQRANMISKELKDKSYVLFLDLDDVFSEINLREAGIHDEHEHGKVVFACRYKNNNICGDTDEEMNVQRLSNEDAENFFWKVVGSHLKSNPDIKPVAKLIINECGGMPHMIKLIGNRLARVDDPAIWRDMLSQLRSPTMEPQEQLEEVYKAFKLVYERLSEEMKPCLLYWAVFPAGYEIFRDHIIDCWRAEQFLSSLRKLPRTRDRGHAILDEFVRKSLLEKGRKWGHFKMYEYFQRVALRIANLKENSHVFVTEDENIILEEWERARRVSLFRTCLSTLPRRPQCCGILTLLLQDSSLTEFPREFFGYMCGLQVLNLYQTRITALPSSICSLINLKGLFFNYCSQLVQLPSQIGDLQNLEILDIRHTGLYSLPIEIGQLANLKCLRVSFTEHVGNHNHVEEMKPMIPSNVIARLSKLEELSIGVSHSSSRYQNATEIAHEISELEELTTLYFFFPEMESFKAFIQNSKSWKGNDTPSAGNNFRSFSIVVGCQRNSSASEFRVFECSAEKHLRFSEGDGFPDSISQVLRQAKAFELIGHQTATSLSVFRSDYLQGLEACIIEECNEMESIIDRGSFQVNDSTGVEFECLKSLHIYNLPKLKDIWQGSIESKSLCGLTTLTLKGCHSIRMLFPHGMIIRLSQLQKLQVEDCCIMKEIIEDRNIVESHTLPKLKILQLRDLPELCFISHVSLQWPSLETILIKACMKMRNLPLTIKNASKLRIIQCTKDWWDQQDSNNTTKDDLRKFLSFI